MNGGAAFPRPASTEYLDGPNETNCTHGEGMSLRDWFGGQALRSLAVSGVEQNFSPQHIAGVVYLLADAMLAHRKTEELETPNQGD